MSPLEERVLKTLAEKLDGSSAVSTELRTQVLSALSGPTLPKAETLAALFDAATGEALA